MNNRPQDADLDNNNNADTTVMTEKTSRTSRTRNKGTAKYTLSNNKETKKTSRASHRRPSLATGKTSRTSFQTV